MKNDKTMGLLLALAFASIFATDVAAQRGRARQAAASGQATAGAAESTGRLAPDMRLWSFGDCDNKFPYVDTDEHKECVRVVGSEEARDARAYRVCETGNPGDAAEVARCKDTYQTNKDRSARSGYVPNVAAQEQAQPTAADLQRVRAIASAAVERESAIAAPAAAPVAAPVAAAAAPNPAPAPEPEEKSGSSTLVIALSVAALLGGGAYAARRKQSATS